MAYILLMMKIFILVTEINLLFCVRPGLALYVTCENYKGPLFTLLLRSVKLPALSNKHFAYFLRIQIKFNINLKNAKFLK